MKPRIERFALIVGAMKAGTTSLFHHLAQHPEVAPSTPKETHFFSRDASDGRGLEAYEAHWEEHDPAVHRWALEASPSYTAQPRSPDAAARIAEVEAEFRFLYVLRDPLARIESHRTHDRRRGKAPSGRATLGIEPDWLDLSRYARQLAAYTARFPPEHVLLLDFTELRAQPAALLRRVCAFLEIDPEHRFSGLGTAHNVGRRDHPLYTALAGSALARGLARALPRATKQGLRNRMARGSEAPERLTAEQREHVLRELAEDVAALAGEHGFDTSRWFPAR